MSLTNSMNAAISGMGAAQNQLNVISNNVSNASTPGYTRKYINQETNVVPGTGVGGGVDANSLSRQVDESLLRSYLNENSDFQNLNTKANFLDQAQSFLGSPSSSNSIAHNVANLQSSFEKFAAAVNDPNANTELINTSEYTLNQLSDISSEIQNLRKEADEQIYANVNKANSLLHQVDTLNDQIVKLSISDPYAVADLEDKRDQALRDISELMNIDYYERSNGEMVIMTSEGSTLLDTEVHELSHTPMSTANPLNSVEAGTISGITVDGKDITKHIKGGEIAGLADVRDEILPELQGELDELTYNMVTELNTTHNRGTAFPPPSNLIGENTLTDPANQSLRIDNGDVKFIIFDNDGNEVSSASLTQDIGFTNGNIYDPANPNDPTTLSGALEAWMKDPAGGNLPSASVYVDDNGGLVIETGDSTYGIGIIDEASSLPGSEKQDVKMSFDADGDGVFDEKVEGFSNFFGLNNFITINGNEAVYESQPLSTHDNWQVNNAVDMMFSDSVNGSNYASVQILPTDTLEDVVEKINNDSDINGNINASLIKEGNNVKLQIVNISGEQLEITETPKLGLINNLGLQPSSTGISKKVEVNNGIKSNSNLIASGKTNYDSNTGKYTVSDTDNSTANDMAKVFSSEVTFKQSGTTPKTTSTISDYSNMIVTKLATDSADASNHAKYKSDMVNSISMKEAAISGVDIDQELTQLIIFQQSYSACANVFTASSEMLEVLVNIGR